MSSIKINIFFNIEQYMYNNFDTGDIILFNGRSIISKVVDDVTNGHWSHIGLVIKDPDYLIKDTSEVKEGLFLFESTGVESIDVDTDTKLFGVQLVDLEKRIERYDGEVVHRKLIWDKSKEYIDNIMRTVYNTTFEKPYDWNPIDLLDPIIVRKCNILDKLLGINHRHTDSFFCSALVAYTYTQLGLLKKDTEWSLVYPQYFADIKDLEDGGKLDDIDIIKN